MAIVKVACMKSYQDTLNKRKKKTKTPTLLLQDLRVRAKLQTAENPLPVRIYAGQDWALKVMISIPCLDACHTTNSPKSKALKKSKYKSTSTEKTISKQCALIKYILSQIHFHYLYRICAESKFEGQKKKPTKLQGDKF